MLDEYDSYDGVECGDVGIASYAFDSVENDCFCGGGGSSSGSVDMSSHGDAEEAG